MSDQTRLRFIIENPIGNGLNGFRTTFTSICEGADLRSAEDAVDQLKREDVQDLAFSLLTALQVLPAARLLPSNSGGVVRSDLLRLISAVASNDFDLERIKPLLKISLLDAATDEQIWNLVDVAAEETTPPPRPIASSLQQTPWFHKTSSFANSSEYRQDVDRVLKSELGQLYVGLLHFRSTFFGAISGLQTGSEAVFQRCKEGSDPLFVDGWKGWPNDANQEKVLSWFADLSEKLATISADYNHMTAHLRRPLAQPNKPIQGSTAERKLDVGFVSDVDAKKDTHCHWSQILVPGELKSNPAADSASKAWLDLGRYAREVLAAQDTRRFVLGFTLCGSFMRIWAFDRLGGVASERFDINEDGLQFVFTILGFLWMSEEQCGFDPTIITRDGERFIEIERNGQTERLVLESLMSRAPCIAGRATTCWKAHREAEPGVPLVVKDSWQYAERDEEGELLQEATERGVVNVARHFHHVTIRIRDQDDDVQGNVRAGLDIRTASNYRPERSAPSTGTGTTDGPRKSRGSGRSSLKRSSSQTGAFLPPNKRPCSASPTKASINPLPNRVHWRIILRDYGKPIYKASTRTALLAALEGCITGHHSLQRAGILHRDISVNNLMINEDEDNPSWPSFLIDLDLAIKEQRVGVSGANGKTGTRAFMAIGSLLGEKHSFMHDLESFFWVIFWICIHYEEPGKGKVVPKFDDWNFRDTEALADLKKGTISDEADFLRSANVHFTRHYHPLIQCVNALRRAVFPNGRRWTKEDAGLYDRMKEILRGARED
ncbi:uncharacterized protein N7498_001756 [Penicillium cinerascens]|uniref:non-specific serine/threonine protein kinase n=1 Tax=Penicillium cinerascens TaxID=70096 RepID=A0A9W9NAG8_9EURO|nr:uncharacterized protein N7498_001756 [Penicillium cinerascens]KAJ5215349.1 hypothetical protein N7498_001756 [Penicillium cinerascens]